jgi:hypothetical protein
MISTPDTGIVQSSFCEINFNIILYLCFNLMVGGFKAISSWMHCGLKLDGCNMNRENEQYIVRMRMCNIIREFLQLSDLYILFCITFFNNCGDTWTGLFLLNQTSYAFHQSFRIVETLITVTNCLLFPDHHHT